MTALPRIFVTRWARDTGGAVAVEFSLLAMALFVLTFGILEMGYLWFQWSAGEKATQIGARYAIVADPVAQGLEAVDCRNVVNFGLNCGAGDSFGTITCTNTGCTGGYARRATVFDEIVGRMRGLLPLIEPQHVEVVYRDIPELRFAGRGRTALFTAGGVVPEVTVRLRNMAFQWWILGPLLGLPAIPLPAFAATLIGEDMNSGGQG